MNITPIETKYKGYRFRSRLEARWAVFFDAAGIDWVYEPQGYVVLGVPYLPDFHLDQFGFFEVKGGGEADPLVMQALAQSTGSMVMVAHREIPCPDGDTGYLETFSPLVDKHDDLRVAWGFDDMFLRCSGCGGITVQNDCYCTLKGNCCDGERFLTLSDALSAGRSARFEHKGLRHSSAS